MPKVRATRGIRYPKRKADREAIRAGEAKADDIPSEDWNRLKGGQAGTLPQDMVSDFDQRSAIEKES